MTTLVNRIVLESEAKYGVNILDRPEQPVVVGANVNRIALVGAFPWGGYDVREFATVADLYKTLAPAEFGNRDNYPSLKALLNKTFPQAVLIKPVEPGTAAVRASSTANDAGAGGSLTLTAKWPGASGNQIRRQWTVNATTAGNRDLTISIVNTLGVVTYSKKYLSVAVGTGPAWSDPGDPWVTLSEHVDFDAVPAADASPVALASGTDGTAVAADWAGAADTFDGVRAFRDANLGANVIFGAEVPESFIDAFNASAVTTAEAIGAIAVLSTPPDMTYDEAVDYVADYDSVRATMAWPRVKTTNGYDPDLELAEDLDGNAFWAVAVASVPPQDSPGGAPGAAYLRGIAGIETKVEVEHYEALRAGGVVGLRQATALGGYIGSGGVVTQIADATRLQISRTRMFDYITSSIASYMERFVGRLLDINLARRSFGPITTQQKAGVDAFLEGLKAAEIINGYTVDWFSGNTQAALDGGRFVVRIRVKLYASQDEIIIDANIGQFVQFSEA